MNFLCNCNIRLTIIFSIFYSQESNVEASGVAEEGCPKSCRGCSYCRGGADPYSTEALLNLGVSYVNELNYEQSLKHLNNWVTHNPNLEISLDIGSDNDNVNALDKVKVLLNHAKEYSQANRNVECTVDVLEALGVVYNVSREYDDAV